jgi:hypothetical protein
VLYRAPRGCITSNHPFPSNLFGIAGRKDRGETARRAARRKIFVATGQFARHAPAACRTRVQIGAEGAKAQLNLTFCTSDARRLPFLREAVSRQFLNLNLAPLTDSAGGDLDAAMSIRQLGA